MDIHQLKTFVAVARGGSITRAAELVHLSQPAVSAHIKAIEDALGLTLFERNSRGMSLTRDGERLLAKAEATLTAYRELMDTAASTQGRLTGKLRVGAGTNSNHAAIGHLLMTFAERYPEVEVMLKHGTSQEVMTGVREGTLEAGFFNEPGVAEADLTTIEVSRFSIFLAAAPGLVDTSKPLDWPALAKLPWVYPTASACCARTAEALFNAHHFRPERVISVDRQVVTRTLITSGVGLGLLHDDAAREGKQSGELELLYESPTKVSVLFAHLASRQQDAVVSSAASVVREGVARHHAMAQAVK